MYLKSKNITLPEEARQYVLYQRTELLPKKQMSFTYRVLNKLGFDIGYKNFVKKYSQNEKRKIDEKYSLIMENNAKLIVPHISKDIHAVMDIGCGIAGINIFLYDFLNKPKIFLLDKTKIEKKIWYMFEKKGAFYNSLELAQNTLQTNGVDSKDIKLIEAPENGIISVKDNFIDLIISNLSWGYHFPVSNYLSSVEKILTKKGMLIIDIRKNTEGEEILKTKFDIQSIFTGNKYITYKCTKLKNISD